MWMVTILKKDWSKIARTAEADKKGIAHHLEDRLTGLSIKRQYIGEAVRRANLNLDKPASWTDEDFYRFVDNLRRISKPLLIVANKIDLKGAEANLKRLQRHVDNQMPIIAVSSEKRIGLERLGETLFKTMNIIRVYTKEPGARNFSANPFTLKRGSTLGDLAKSIHSDFRDNFAFAKVWAKSPWITLMLLPT